VINIVMVRVAGVGRHEASFGDEVPNWLGKWAQVRVALLVTPETPTSILILRTSAR